MDIRWELTWKHSGWKTHLRAKVDLPIFFCSFWFCATLKLLWINLSCFSFQALKPAPTSSLSVPWSINIFFFLTYLNSSFSNTLVFMKYTLQSSSSFPVIAPSLFTPSCLCTSLILIFPSPLTSILISFVSVETAFKLFPPAWVYKTLLLFHLPPYFPFSFCNLLSPLWVLSWAFPSLKVPSSSQLFQYFGILLQILFFLSTDDFWLRQNWNYPAHLASICLLAPSPTFLSSQFDHLLESTNYVHYLSTLADLRSYQGHYFIIHLCLSSICCCLKCYFNFHSGSSETVLFRLSFPEQSPSSKLLLLPPLTNTPNNTIFFSFLLAD